MVVRNVVSYGAIGDGITDDTLSVQEAAVACQDGDRLYFPGSSTYFIDYFVVPASNVTVTGDSSSVRATIKKRTASGTNTPFISSLDKDNITVQNLILNGQGSNQTWWDPDPYTADFVVFADNIQFKGGTGHAATNIYTHHAGSAGVRVYGCTNVTLTNIVGDNNGFGTVATYARTYDDGHGTPHSSGIVLNGGSASFDYCDGVRYVQTDDSSMANFDSSYCRNIITAPVQFAGFYLQDCDRITLNGCSGRGNSRMGFDANEGAGGTNDCNILNCTWGPETEGSEVLLGTSNFLIQNNLFLGDSARIEARCDNHIIRGNVFRDFISLPRIRLQDINVTNLTLEGNDFRGNAGTNVDPLLRNTPGFSETGSITDANAPNVKISPLAGILSLL